MNERLNEDIIEVLTQLQDIMLRKKEIHRAMGYRKTLDLVMNIDYDINKNNLG